MSRKLPFTAALLLSIVILMGCSKSIFFDTENRLEGDWELVDVDRIGFGGRPEFPFTSGQFSFQPGGQAQYTDRFGNRSTGSWDLRNVDNNNAFGLFITMVDFNTQQIRTEYYDEVRIFSRRKFKAYIQRRGTRWVFEFNRR